MEKAINEKTKKINVIYGFFNDNNYGVDYPTLIDSIELVDLFPYLNKGETELEITHYTVDPLILALRSACPKLNEGRWDETSKHTYYVEVATMKYEPIISVCFRIVENAA